MTLRAGELILVYLLIWAFTLTTAFWLSSFGINLMGDPRSIKIAGELSNFGIFTASIGTAFTGALLMVRRSNDN